MHNNEEFTSWHTTVKKDSELTSSCMEDKGPLIWDHTFLQKSKQSELNWKLKWLSVWKKMRRYSNSWRWALNSSPQIKHFRGWRDIYKVYGENTQFHLREKHHPDAEYLWGTADSRQSDAACRTARSSQPIEREIEKGKQTSPQN